MESAINFLTPESPPVPDGLQHKDLVTHISHITLPNGADRYITCGKDGVVKVWNAKVGNLGPHSATGDLTFYI